MNPRNRGAFQQSRSLGVSTTEIEIEDEEYEEMVEQLEAFKSSSKTEMILPPGKYYLILGVVLRDGTIL